MTRFTHFGQSVNGRPKHGLEQIKVLFSCSGVGILNRGIESFFREAFGGLKSTPGLETRLVKGAQDKSEIQEPVVWCLPRTGRAAPLIGKLTGRSAYAVEQWSSFPGVVRQIRKFRPHVIFYSDANLGFLLYRFRRQIGVPFKLLFSNGGPCRPPFDRCDFVQQVAPHYHAEAIAAGERTEKHFMVPYGIHVPEQLPEVDSKAKANLRRQLGLPADRPIILSVGWIARAHKRMDYMIEEVAQLPQPRPFLQLLGAMDAASPEIVELGNRLLGPGNFSARSVPYEQVAQYYQAADCFVLASLKEGFGRVYLEALMHGLPTIGHRHPVIEYVLGKDGIAADLSQPGVLADLLQRELKAALNGSEGQNSLSETARHRWASVRDRFSWPVLASQYASMFRKVAQFALPDFPNSKS
jgi:glycosyltransferase involved in cell wall biosynthesis